MKTDIGRLFQQGDVAVHRFAVLSQLSYNLSKRGADVSEKTDRLQVATDTVTAIAASVETVVRGKHEQVLLALVPMIAGGHLLLQDVPGVGKSTLAQALGQSIGASYSRIQFTSDLLPADILGVNIYEAATGEFRFRRGPIFANVVMADEINRARPKTQSALLEAMNDRRITIDGMTWELPDPFFVIATQNPIEYAGTYPLPELSLIHISEPTRLGMISYAVFCLKKKKNADDVG